VSRLRERGLGTVATVLAAAITGACFPGITDVSVAQAATFTIHGHILKGTERKPLPGLSVSLHVVQGNEELPGRNATSGPDGGFAFRPRPRRGTPFPAEYEGAYYTEGPSTRRARMQFRIRGLRRGPRPDSVRVAIIHHRRARAGGSQDHRDRRVRTGDDLFRERGSATRRTSACALAFRPRSGIPGGNGRRRPDRAGAGPRPRGLRPIPPRTRASASTSMPMSGRGSRTGSVPDGPLVVPERLGFRVPEFAGGGTRADENFRSIKARTSPSGPKSRCASRAPASGPIPRSIRG
jgi:hypothetical protein